MTSLSWTVWDDCWKQLPYSVFYNILQFIDSIDIRRHFKLRPRKLILPENYKNKLDNKIINFEVKKNCVLFYSVV